MLRTPSDSPSSTYEAMTNYPISDLACMVWTPRGIVKDLECRSPIVADYRLQRNIWSGIENLFGVFYIDPLLSRASAHDLS